MNSHKLQLHQPTVSTSYDCSKVKRATLPLEILEGARKVGTIVGVRKFYVARWPYASAMIEATGLANNVSKISLSLIEE